MTKEYNTLTGPSHKFVDETTHRLAHAFIWSCNQLTPAKEAELDAIYCEIERLYPEKDKKVCIPNVDVIAENPEPDWMLTEPGPEAFDYDC